jgi:hypothetical protein
LPTPYSLRLHHPWRTVTPGLQLLYSLFFGAQIPERFIAVQ